MVDAQIFDVLFGLPYSLPGDGLVIDFTVALVFFTALSFAVLGRRFGHQRSAAVMSTAMGIALALGLVTWEMRTGLRLSALGPIAAGLGLVMIALVIYHAIRRVGGSWAGGLTALGATLLIGQVLAVPGLSRLLNGVLGPLIAVGLLAVGASKLMMQIQKKDVSIGSAAVSAPWRPAIETTIPDGRPPSGGAPVRDATQQVHAIDDVQRLNHRLDQHLTLAKQNAELLPAQPQLAALLRRQLAAMLPESQTVTQRLADLRAKTQMLRLGHLAKIRRLAPQIPKLPPAAARVASAQLREAYKEARLEERIGRLDQAAVHAEQRIAAVVVEVNRMLDAGRYDHAAKTLQDAEKLARQVQRLLKQIENDEKKVLSLAVKATQAQKAGKRAA